ncbi:tRNA pseudouridine(55) synthase TruB [Paenibacillaceae bacterium]|nr:tRNA pseudouridine(55) synthase TruB [Paenibacillaceae bacterium]
MDGVLAVWKPKGWTSHDVVAKTRGLLRIKRIGHAGTLDPEVTGVLPLCIGRATRVVEYMQDLPKEYEAVLQFGTATDTEDLTGTVLQDVPNIQLTESRVREVLDSFVGDIEQIPPMYSAVKVDGKRLYELARAGKVVERKARMATIHHIRLLSLELEQTYPRIAFSVSCSKGTYIRTLCVDIGQKLGVPAAMAELRRTRSAGLSEDACLTLEQISELKENGKLQDHLLAPDAVLGHLERVVVSNNTALLAMQGQKISLASAYEAPEKDGLLRLYNENGVFAGIFQADIPAGVIRPVKVFSSVGASS